MKSRTKSRCVSLGSKMIVSKRVITSLLPILPQPQQVAIIRLLVGGKVQAPTLLLL